MELQFVQWLGEQSGMVIMFAIITFYGYRVMKDASKREREHARAMIDSIERMFQSMAETRGAIDENTKAIREWNGKFSRTIQQLEGISRDLERLRE